METSKGSNLMTAINEHGDHLMTPLHIPENEIGIQKNPHNSFKISIEKKLKENIKSELKNRFGAHWNDEYRAFTCHINKKILVRAYLHRNLNSDGIEFTLEDVDDAYHNLPPAHQKIERLNEAERLKTIEGLYKIGNLKECIKDFNHRYQTNLESKNFKETTFDELIALLKTEDNNQIEHLKILLDIYTDFEKTHNEVKEIKEKSSQLENLDCGELILSPKTPLDNAEKLIEIKYTTTTGDKTIHYFGDAFWEWKGKHYEELRHNRVRQISYEFLKNAKVEQIDRKGNSYKSNFDPNQSKVNNFIDALKATCECNLIPESGISWIKKEENFPEARNLIVFNNGILNTEEYLHGQNYILIPHTPTLLNTGYLSFDFSLNSQPLEWLKYLQSLWPCDQQSINTLQEWFGYCLTQDTRMHKILLIVGPPRSGKGTIGRILRTLLNESNTIGPTLSSLSGGFGLESWLNKSLAVISDARLSSKSDQGLITERLLQISGEDPLTIERKHRMAITTKLPTRIMILTNELPNLRDSSCALANRYIVLPQSVSWLGREDVELEIRLRQELPQILGWALDGLKRLRGRNRFLQPESADQHIEELLAMSSPVKAFISERCEIGPQKWIETKALFAAWGKWCEESGHDRPGNEQVFGRNLRAVIPGIHTTQPRIEGRKTRVYNGIQLSILPN
jgi:putative DNA primase/helicase